MKNQTKTTLTFLGDLMCNKKLIALSKTPSGDYDFTPSFANVKPYLTNSAYVIGNLETPIDSKRGNAFTPREKGFNSPPEYVEAAADAGVDLFLTGNNHCYDHECEKGLLTTLKMLDSYHLEHTGTYATKEDSEKLFIREVNGIKIAFLNYTFGINYNVHGNLLPKEKGYQINFLVPPEYHELEDWWNLFPFLLKHRLPDGFHKFLLHTKKTYSYQEFTQKIQNDISAAKEQGAECIVLLPHFGIECITRPLRFQRKWCEMMFKAGADIIIGGHPHTLQPMEFREIEDRFGASKKRFLIYSLGNFISQEVSYCPHDLSTMSVILNVHLERSQKTGMVEITSADCIPTWIHAASPDKPVAVHVLPDEIKAAHANNDTVLEKKLIGIQKRIHSIITASENTSAHLSWEFLPDSDVQHKERWIYPQDVKYLFTGFPMQVFGTAYSVFIPEKLRVRISKMRGTYKP